MQECFPKCSGLRTAIITQGRETEDKEKSEYMESGIAGTKTGDPIAYL